MTDEEEEIYNKAVEQPKKVSKKTLDKLVVLTGRKKEKEPPKKVKSNKQKLSDRALQMMTNTQHKGLSSNIRGGSIHRVLKNRQQSKSNIETLDKIHIIMLMLTCPFAIPIPFWAFLLIPNVFGVFLLILATICYWFVWFHIGRLLVR